MSFVDPPCTFKGDCFAKSNNRCVCLHNMPKPLKNGKCPFQKKYRSQVVTLEEEK